MKKLYILILCILASTAMFADEVFTTTNIIETETAIDRNSNLALNALDVSQNDQITEKVHTSYNDGKLIITGINTTTSIAIYNLLGRKVIDLKNVAINGTYTKHIDLPKNNIYIVKITAATFSKTFKIVAK